MHVVTKMRNNIRKVLISPFRKVHASYSVEKCKQNQLPTKVLKKTNFASVVLTKSIIWNGH